MPLEHGFRRGVGFLAVDAPVFQLFERDPNARDSATHIGARRDHAEIAVKILHLGLADARGTEPVQHVSLHPVHRWPSAGPRTPFIYMMHFGNGSALWCNRGFLTIGKVKPYSFVINWLGAG